MDAVEDVGRFLTARETAERLAVSEAWVWRNPEVVGAVKLGRRWRVPAARVSALIDGVPV